MPNGASLEDDIRAAVLRGGHVSQITRLAVADGPGGRVVGLRIALPARLRLPEVVVATSAAEREVLALAGPGTQVFVEPDIAADSKTPTEVIVIRALD